MNEFPPLGMPAKASQTSYRTLLFVILGVLLTTLIVGGAVYAWQQTIHNREIVALEQQVQGLQQQLSASQDTISVPSETSLSHDNVVVDAPTNTPQVNSVVITRETVYGQPQPLSNNERPATEFLNLRGVVTQKLLVRQAELGALKYVNPTQYKDPTILAAFTSFYAGAGDNVVVRRTEDGKLQIEHQEHGEVGQAPYHCGPVNIVAEIPVPSTTIVTFENLGSPTANTLVCN